MHNCYGRLSRIDVPTWSSTAPHDRMIPVENARMMAERIPDAGCGSSTSRATSTRPRSPSVDEEIAAFLDGAPLSRARARVCLN